MLPKFLFIHPEEENIGIEYLSASLKMNNIPIELLFVPRVYNNIAFHFNKSKRAKPEFWLTKAKIKEFKPDVVCFSPFTSQYLWTIDQATRIKKMFPKIIVLYGGVHVNSVPEEVVKQKCIDAIIVGEGDKQIVEFARNFSDKRSWGNIKSLWFKQGKRIVKNNLAPLIADLDILPYPDKDIFYKQIPQPLLETTYVIMASRGCPYSCTYCANNVYQRLYAGQKRLRFRSPENVVAELLWAKDKYHFKMVEFFDDVLAVDDKRLDELMDLYRKKVKLPFTCYMHPQLINEQIVKTLKVSGCCWLKMGVQSANEQYRRKYLNRGETNEQVLSAARLCRKYGLQFSLDHIFNLPGETEENLVEAVKLYSMCRPTIINYGTLIYLPGTDIIKYGVESGLLSKSDVKLINEGRDPVVHMSNIELFSHRNKNINNINLSVFAMFMSFIPISSEWFINWLIKIRVYKIKISTPKLILIFLKILTKIKAKQMYLYFSVFKTLFYYYQNDRKELNS